MIRLFFLLLLAVAMIASVVVILRRPVSLLSKIQFALTALVVVAFTVGMKMAMWLHSMAYADPVRQEWKPRLDMISGILWFGTVIPWLFFTIYHVIVRVRQKPAAYKSPEPAAVGAGRSNGAVHGASRRWLSLFR